MIRQKYKDHLHHCLSQCKKFLTFQIHACDHTMFNMVTFIPVKFFSIHAFTNRKDSFFHQHARFFADIFEAITSMLTDLSNC